MTTQTKETRTMTGAELVNAYEKQNESFERIIRNREKQLDYINSLPESETRQTDKGEITINKEQQLRSVARVEAINVLTNGEYKKKLSMASDLNKKKVREGLTPEEERSLERTRDRIAGMNKYSRHPEQANEMKRLLEYCYERNCTEQGISATINETREKIEANNSLIEKLKGVENTEFTINIKHDKSLGKLQLDEGFTTQLNSALAAKAEKQAEKPKTRTNGKKKGQEPTM
jgi:hypothetical protein